MHCAFPKPAGNGLRPCGGCWPCRINKRREWTGRILLESMWWPESSFVTLTYDDDHIPVTPEGLQVLYRKDYDMFRRNFARSSFGPNYRWYGVAEYGDESMRPHYHFIMFGAGAGWLEQFKLAWSVKRSRRNERSDDWKNGRILRNEKGKLRKTLGFVTAEPLIPERAAYAAGYVAKKMNKPDDTRLQGRPPEFRSMAKQHGGIGSSGLGWLADLHMTKAGSKAMAKHRDVMNAIKVDGKTYPIGPYLRSQLRELLGVDETQAKRDSQLRDYEDDLVFAPPIDLMEIESLPHNRRLLNGKKAQQATEAYFKIEKQKRRPKGLQINRGAQI